MEKRNPFIVGQRVIDKITDTFQPHGTICEIRGNICFVSFDDSAIRNICHYSELKPINE